MVNLEKKIIHYCEHQTPGVVDQFAQDVEEGLSLKHKMLPCKYIYDEEGSRLFQEIMALPEYYLTDCEIEILRENKDFFAHLWGKKKFYLFELGAGDGKKTRILLHHFQKRGIDFHYIPIDISSSAVEELIQDLSHDFCHMKMTGLVSEYFQGIEYLSGNDDITRVVLFLGSNIGNMNPDQVHEFLMRIYHSLEHGDYLLLGCDLVKDPGILTRAYNDPSGVTAQFNKNLLARINKELGGTFDLDYFVYHSVYEPQQWAINSYLISTKKQEVYIEAVDSFFTIEKWEAIHTESSYKFSVAGIEKMAANNGFIVMKHFYDPWHFFIDSLWQVNKEG